MDLFTLTAKLGLDTSDYETKIADVVKSAKEAGGEIDTALGGGASTPSATATTIGTAQKSMSSFWGTTKAILASGAIQKGLSTISSVGKEAVETASDLVEVQNVVDQTFGASAASIDAWATTTARNYGLSELQAKQFTGYMGAALQSSGIDQAQAAEMATNIAGLAGDMASFYNIGIEDAFQKIQSGMAGETEPLRRYGLNLGAESVGAYAGADVSDMTEAERYVARYDYLMNATKTIQGDFARTENEFANASRTLENNASRAMAAMGEKVLPIITAGTNAANSLFDALLSESPEDTLAGIDAAMADTTAGIEQSASAARAATSVLEDFGDKSALTAEQQKQWEAVATELVRTIPELAGQINMQTGEIEGGTQAIEENISAWEEAGKAAAQTSALEAKRDMLSGIADEITKEQGLLATAQKEMEQHVYDTAAIGTMIAQQLGVEFDGTAESFRSMMDSMAAYAAAESLGFSDADISDALSGYDSASEKAEEHRKRIAELQAEYDTVEAGVSESTVAMQSSVGALEGKVTESFDGIETATDGLLTGFDQSDTAYNNAYNTGIGAANGLSDAYGSFSAAANAYSLRASLIGGGVPSVFSAPKLAVGMDYVPYDEYPAQLHEGEAVLTKAEAADWRRGVDRAQGPTAAEIGHAVADAMRETLNGLGVYMGADRVGDLVTERVSRNIAKNAHKRRFSPV